MIKPYRFRQTHLFEKSRKAPGRQALHGFVVWLSKVNHFRIHEAPEVIEG